jgi:hypothetical protein
VSCATYRLWKWSSSAWSWLSHTLGDTAMAMNRDNRRNTEEDPLHCHTAHQKSSMKPPRTEPKTPWWKPSV